jgi:hypothetical protein
MNGRWFAQRQLKAELYDGWTDYDVKESEEDRILREKKWEEWLEKEGEEEEGRRGGGGGGGGGGDDNKEKNESQNTSTKQ